MFRKKKVNYFVLITKRKLITIIAGIAIFSCLSFTNVSGFFSLQTQASKNVSQISNIVDGDHIFVVNGNRLTNYYGPGGNIVIPEGIEIIGQSAFSQMNITGVVFPESLVSIESSAFESTKIEQVEFPKGLKTIGNSAFRNNKLKTLEIPSTVDTIADYAFSSNSIYDLKLNEGLKTIGSYSFAYNSLSNIIIPKTVETIKSRAYHWNYIRRIEFEGNKPTLGEFWIEPFSGVHQYIGLHYLESATGWDTSPYLIANKSNVTIFMEENIIPFVSTENVTLPVGKANSDHIFRNISIHDDNPSSVITSIVASNVDFNKVGTYEVEVKVIDDKKQERLSNIEVYIVEKIPSPNISSSDLTFKADFFSTNDLLSEVTAIDYYGNEIKVEVNYHDILFDTPGKYNVRYRAIDEFDNETFSTNVVTVLVNNKPIIYSSDIEFALGTMTYENLLDGVTAFDEDDGDLKVTIKNHNVQLYTTGEYYITYQAIDSEGNITERTNKVKVRSNSFPFASYNDLYLYKGEGKIDDISTVLTIYDEEDGYLNYFVVEHNIDFNQVGTYFAKVSATDSDKNRIEVILTVIVSYHPDSLPHANWYDIYLESGAGRIEDIKYYVNCVDKEDGKLDFILTSHDIDFNRIGKYYVEGYCIDSDNNKLDISMHVYITEKYTFDGWVLERNRWKFYKNGSPVNGWQSIDGLQYYFEDYRMVSDWWLDKNTGAWYFFNGGVMQRTNLLINGRVNAFDTYGVWKGIVYEDGWELQSNNKWKYYKNNKAVNGWQSIEGLQYYFENSEMVSDWWLDKNTGAWYFFNGGVMQRTNLIINGKLNIFDTHGVWKGIK